MSSREIQPSDTEQLLRMMCDSPGVQSVLLVWMQRQHNQRQGTF